MKELNKRPATKFSVLYWGEVKKSFSPALIISILVIAILMILLMTFMIKGINVDTDSGDLYINNNLDERDIEVLAIENPFEPDSDDLQNYSRALNTLLFESMTDKGSYIFTDAEAIENVLELAVAEKKAIDKTRKEEKLKFFKKNLSDPYYNLRQEVNTLKYIKEHLIGKEVFLPQNTSLMGSLMYSSSPIMSSNDIFKILLVTLMQTIAMYGVIVGSRAYSQEFRSGSVKMLMVRPITRNQLTSAKTLAVVTHSSLMYMALTLVVFIISMVLSTVSKAPTLFSFNAGAFSYTGAHMEMLYLWLLNFAICISWSILCFAISSIFKNMVVGIMAYFILPSLSLPLHYIALDTVFITSALNWGSYFNASGEYPIAIGSNFFITLALWVVYIGGFMALTYYKVNKRDLA